MRVAAAALCALAVAFAGCGGGGDGDDAARTATGERGAPVGGRSAEATAIRGWITVLNAGNHDQAADYFAPGAIIEQGRIARLRTHAQAVAFNRSLPCKATVTDIEKKGATVVAAFKLRPGPGAPESCGGKRGARALQVPRRQVLRVAPDPRVGGARGAERVSGELPERRPARGELLVSDRARERAESILRRAFAHGRFEADELERRLDIVNRARTREEIRSVQRDLPEYRRDRLRRRLERRRQGLWDVFLPWRWFRRR